MEVDEKGRPVHAGTVLVLRRNGVAPAVALAIAAVALLAPPISPYLPAGGFIAWISGCFAFFTVLRNAFRLSRATTFHATAEALELEGRPPILATDIIEVKSTPHRAATRAVDAAGEVDVELSLRGGGSVTLRMHEGARDAMLAALGIAAGERRASFRLEVPFARRFVGAYALIVTLWALFLMTMNLSVAEFVRIPLLALVPAVVLAALSGLLRGKVVVGGDGFAVRWLFSRFVPFGDVSQVTSSATGLETTVALRSGRRVRLRALETPEDDAHRGAAGRALFAHIDDAFTRHSRASAAAATRLLERGERSARDWLAGLDTVVRGSGTSYRVAAVTAETLVEVTRAPDGPVDARVGAAAALVRLGGDTHRPMVRVVAEACADPQARAALESVAEARTDDEVEAALKRMTGR